MVRGDVCAIDTKNSLVFADHRLVATLGCENLVVVETADSVMVADKSRTQNVKAIVDWLSQQNREERLTHRRVYRPWGSYESIDKGERFQVKRSCRRESEYEKIVSRECTKSRFPSTCFARAKYNCASRVSSS